MDRKYQLKGTRRILALPIDRAIEDAVEKSMALIMERCLVLCELYGEQMPVVAPAFMTEVAGNLMRASLDAINIVTNGERKAANRKFVENLIRKGLGGGDEEAGDD